MKLKLLILTILFAINASHSFSNRKINISSTSFQSITMRDGLPSLAVDHIEEDEFGFMYFSTRKGLSVYDGNFFFTYNAKTVDGFSNSINYCKSLDSRKCLVATQDNGLFLFHKHKQKISKLDICVNNTELPNVKIIYQDSKQNIWIGTYDGELFLTTLDDLIASKSSKKELIKIEVPVATFIHSIVEFNGHILIASPRSVLALDTSLEYLKYKKIFQFDNNEIITSLSKNEDNELILGSPQGGYRLKSALDRPYIENIYKIKKDYFKRAIHYKNNYLIVQHNNLHIISPEGKESVVGNSMISKNIMCAHIDRQGRLWLGCSLSGIIKIDLSTEYNRYKSKATKNNVVSWTLVADTINDIVYVGTFSEGLCKLDIVNNSYGATGNLEAPILCFYNDVKHSRIYVGTVGDGIVSIDQKTNRLKKLSFSNMDHQRVTFIDRKSDSELWIGTADKGLWILDEEHQTVNSIVFPTGYSVNWNVRSVIADPIRNGYWIGTYDLGLIYIEVDHNYTVTKTVTVNNENGSNKINRLFLDEEKLWVCLSDGLSSVDLKDVDYQMVAFDKLKWSFVSDFLKTGDSEYWIATYEGLFRFNSKKDELTRFMSEDTHYKLSLFSDCIYSCTSNGVVKVHFQGIINKNKDAYPYVYDIHIDGVLDTVNGLSVASMCDTVVLEASSQNIEFKVSTLTFSEVGENVFFKLSSVDDTWRTSDMMPTSINYSNIPAGDSEFVIRLKSPNNIAQEKRVLIHKKNFWWRTTTFKSLCYLFLIVLFLVILNYLKKRSRRKMDEQLNIIEQESDQELYKQRTRFFTNISHDIKTPLTLLLSPISDLMEQPDIPLKYSTQLKSMSINGQVLLNKINKILKYRESEFNNDELEIVSCSVHQIILDIVIPFKEYAQSKGIHFDFNSEMENNIPIMIKTDINKLESILENLILNAITYTPYGGKIKVTYKLIDSKIEFIVSDSGVGISEEKIPNIFNQFYRIGDDDKGTGIGLYLVKLFIDQMSGDINVESQEGVGTSFKFYIPIELDHLATENSHIDDYANETIDIVRMLVVDDNKDMCDYLALIFSPYYQVTTLYDGEQAKNEIDRSMPDIIISDLMMVSIGGIELCRYSKSNILTSHIPFIIISAKSDMATKTACFEAGADMFEEKPFTKKNLLARVSSLIKSRKLLKYKYKLGMPSQEQLENLDSKLVSQESLDEKFIATVNDVINKHLQDSEFSVEELTKELSIRHEQLYKKIKALTGYTISHYIRSYRLNCAAELLKDGKYTVTEVLYSVGFNNPSYFTRSFKKQFGVLPSEYVSGNKLE